MAIWKPAPLWEGSDCFIIGGGPSILTESGVPVDLAEEIKARKVPLSTLSSYMPQLHQRHCIGVNLAYSIGPWIDFCFFGDSGFYLHHKQHLVPWPGIKVSCAPRFAERDDRDPEGIKFMSKDSRKRSGISMDRGKVAWNQNSGAASISLAAQLGVKRIVLIGFDMSLDTGGTSHWHGYHREIKGNPENRRGIRRKGTLKGPPFNRHLRGFPVIAEDAKKLGIEILNASPNSAITEFKKVRLRDVL